MDTVSKRCDSAVSSQTKSKKIKKPLDKSASRCYNKDTRTENNSCLELSGGCQAGMTTIRPNQAKQKKVQKVLDKPHRVCYNKDTNKTNKRKNEVGTMTNTSKKMTKREMFEQIKANYALTADEVAFIDHELELLAKKNSTDKKPTATQLANEGIKTAILNHMEVGKGYTITDFIKSVAECSELSTPKVSALVKQLKDDGVIERYEEKRKAYFRLV